MEQFNTAKSVAEEVRLRRSSRHNKGIPPIRYGNANSSEADSNITTGNGIRVQDANFQEGYKDAPGKATSAKSIINREYSWMFEPTTKSDIVRPSCIDQGNKQKLVLQKNNSVSSKSSNVSQLNFEMERLQQLKQFEEQESEERLKLIAKKRQIAMEQLEIKHQLLEETNRKSEGGSIISKVQSENLYNDPIQLTKWVENCEISRTELPQENNQTFFGGGEDDKNLLLQIAKQCVQSTANTTKLLAKQKMRDLNHFSGDITDWPIFISEFRRSTELYSLTNYDNLLRLDNALKGRARDTVKALLTSPENVPRIIKMLEMNFGRSDWIVLSLMDKVKKFSNVKEDKIESCIAFSNALNNMVITMKNVNSTVYMYNPEMLTILAEKLPPIQKYSWSKLKKQMDIQGVPTSLEDFATWYEEEISSMAAISNPFQRNKFPQKRETIMNVNQSRNQTCCVFCKIASHKIKDCPEFLQKTMEDKRQIVLKLKLCFLCLREGHAVKRCSLKTRCGNNGCRGRHNHLLHVERAPAADSRNESNLYRENSNEMAPPRSVDFSANVSHKNEAILLRIAPIILRGPDKEIHTFALFDEGSTCTIIEEDLAKKLELNGPTVPLCFQWTNDITHYEDASRLVSLDIAAGNGNSPYYKLHNVRTVNKLSLPRQKIDVNMMISKFPHLDPDIICTINNATPELLIGQDNCGLTVPREVIQPRLNQPIMSRAKLGWTIHGMVRKDLSSSEFRSVNLCCEYSRDEELHKMIKDSFLLEDFGIKTQENIVKSVEDKQAVKIMENTLRYVGDRFEIGHLYRNADATFPDSKNNALKRLMCMERKMAQNKEFKNQYCLKIEEYIHKGYARKLKTSEVTVNPKDWYLPHFAVWNINKPGKIRLVFDAAAKSFGYSLNDFLYQGPDYVPSLFAVLLRFRQGKIKDMFHQVVIRPEDRCSQRFFWRGGNQSRSPDVYEMNVMIFGAVSSPSKAQFVKNRNAEIFKAECPGILRAMTKQHYVDDFLDSCDTEAEAIRRVRQVIHVHKRGGFEMAKWMSNSRKVMDSIPEYLKTETSSIKIGSEVIERVLGLSWSPASDEFVFMLNFSKIPNEISQGDKVPTKREVLRVIMSVFDPLNFLAPLIIKARILMQDIWRFNVDWDTPIPDELFLNWKQWLQDLHALAPIVVSRYYFPDLSRIPLVDLHLFSDASDKAYASVAYLRLRTGDKFTTSFVTSKFKVAPLNQQTIPKLELQGAVLSCRVAKLICNELEFKINEIHYWTDSLVVLKQIRSQCKRFPMFVACRIGEIHENTDKAQWHWVPTDQNVADSATKVKHIDLSPQSQWFTGPRFLTLPDELWPEEPNCESLDYSFLLLDTLNLDDIKEVPDISRFSKYLRLLRTTGWILHFVKVSRQKKEMRPENLHLNELTLRQAANLLVRKIQKDSFGDELLALNKNKSVPKSSRIFKLSPFLDEYGVIRLKGRFPESQELNLEFDVRCPVILDPKHKICTLLIQYYHEQAGHVGVETVLNNLRLKYWILHMRSSVKKVFNNCKACSIRKCKPVSQEMGLLPRERLESFIFPFSYVGIDFFGPMNVSIGRRSEKRYGVLFTCLTIRAVHVEIAASLDTSSTILAIRRFMCRRGQPIQFITDNGTNFVGAERELREWVQSFDHTKIADELSPRGISWKFNPPAAPHMGGIWERMVRSIKTALKVTLKTVKPKEEVLQTLLAEAEYMVNSRPLTHVSVDPNDCEAITPNHFLLLRPGGIRSHGEVKGDILSRKQWRFAEAVANHYWRRWVLEYRPTLINRQKWHTKSHSFKIGDIVIVVDEKAPRNEWLMGKITNVYPGKDGVVRVADVQTKRGTYLRPVNKLCLLPTN